MNIFEKIITEKLNCYFISPHFDDAAYSAGSLIAYLVNKTPVYVINVFTEASSGPYTISAKTYLKKCGFDDAKKLYNRRAKEDKNLFRVLKVKTFNVGLVDALWRTKDQNLTDNKLVKLFPELVHIYPTYRFHIISGNISNQDNAGNKLKAKLKLTVNKAAKSIVFCPLGIGNHVDHLIVRDICTEIFHNLVYWLDFPYVKDSKFDKRYINVNKLKEIKFKHNYAIKRKMVTAYKTQLEPVFKGENIPDVPERYFTNEN